jgi:DNA helicase-2/ATP-dependent DNA helicase PcrA
VNTDPVEGRHVELVAHLNAPQREAVLHEGGPLVVFAGAGSGKTRVITHRVANLVAERGVAPWNILAVTFTNRAAGEMRERLGHMLGGDKVRDVWVGTFHAVCARLLRRYAAEVGVKRDFTIYDDSDQRAMVKRVLRDLSLDEKRFPPKIVAGRINHAKQEVVRPEDMTPGNYWEEHVVQVYKTYEERMRAASALDFDDLIYRLVLAVEADEQLRGELARRFKHLLVDEFQDTNRVQYRLVRAIAAQHRQVTVVGDDDQSIYRWRGADRRNILGFKTEFPDAHVVKLEQNYRSTKRILRAAHSIIRRNVDREPKQLWTDNEDGAKVALIRCLDEREEAELVVRAVSEMRAAGAELTDMAVFYRIHSQSRVLEEALRAARVNYRIFGGVRFYDRAEVKDLLAYLRLAQNPSDDVSLLRVLNVPPRGIGKKSIEQLLDRAAAKGTGVWAALEEAAQEKSGPAKRFAEFLSVIAGIRKRVADGEKLPAIGYAAFVDTGYEAWLKEQDNAEADARKQNVEELLGSMQEQAEQDPELTLEGFLELVTLKTDVESSEGDARKLTLMTVHSAKGLEFPIVIVTGLEDGLFPFERETEVESDALEELEEERRLAYVALTRAREKLLLTYATSRRIYGRLKPGVRSRFLDELPAEDVQLVGGRSTPSRVPQRPAYSGRSYEEPRSEPRRSNETYVDRSEGSDLDGLRVGMAVRHVKFGRGRVLRINPSVPPRVDVQFGAEWGVKTIQLDYLQPA